MSKRKDREKAHIRKQLDPNYQGFRGYESKPQPKPDLKSVVCTVCGRKKNVPLDVEEEGYICASCRESLKTDSDKSAE